MKNNTQQSQDVRSSQQPEPNAWTRNAPGKQSAEITKGREVVMTKNRGVVYTRPGEVQVQDIADPKFENPQGRKIEHGVILKVVSTNICGSDQHMVRGRTSAPAGMVLGHEITGEVIEKG